jgi:hypothetical protein
MKHGPDTEGWVICSTYPAFDEACSGCRGRCEVLYFLHPTFHTVKMDCLQYCANFPAKSEKYANLAFNILCWALWWRGDNQKIEGWNQCEHCYNVTNRPRIETGHRKTQKGPQVDYRLDKQCNRKATDGHCSRQAKNRQSLLQTGHR